MIQKTEKNLYEVELFVGSTSVGTYNVEAWDEDSARELAWGLAENKFSANIKHTWRVITEVHAEWHGELGSILFYVEFADGKELCIGQCVPEEEPTFAKATTDEEFDNSDYEEWYNEALEEAHRQFYKLEGEEFAEYADQEE